MIGNAVEIKKGVLARHVSYSAVLRVRGRTGADCCALAPVAGVASSISRADGVVQAEAEAVGGSSDSAARRTALWSRRLFQKAFQVPIDALRQEQRDGDEERAQRKQPEFGIGRG